MATQLTPMSVPCPCVSGGVGQVISYRLDIWFSENSNSKPLALLILTLLLVGIGTSALFAASGGTIQDELWLAVAGVGIDWTFAGDEDRSTVERLVALFVSLGGMLVTALMLGIVSDTIGEKMDELRKGTSEARDALALCVLFPVLFLRRRQRSRSCVVESEAPELSSPRSAQPPFIYFITYI